MDQLVEVVVVLQVHRLVQAGAELGLNGRNHLRRDATGQLTDELLNRVSRHKAGKDEIDGNGHPRGKGVDPQPSKKHFHYDAIALTRCFPFLLSQPRHEFLSQSDENSHCVRALDRVYAEANRKHTTRWCEYF